MHAMYMETRYRENPIKKDGTAFKVQMSTCPGESHPGADNFYANFFPFPPLQLRGR